MKKINQDGFVEENVDNRGYLSDEFMGIVKSSVPILCVDVVLITSGKKAILFKRTDEDVASPGEYWLVGGRQFIGESFLSTAKRKVKSEAGIDLKEGDFLFLFAEDLFYKKNEEGKYVRISEDDLPKDKRLVYHTPVICYAARLSSIEEVESKLLPGEGNEDYKVFDELDEGLDPYVKKAVEKARGKL